jgi:hypothetical protein
VEQKSWTIDVDGGQHSVVLNWTYFGGRREVTVDRQVVSKSTIPMRWRSTQGFKIDGHPAVVRTKPSGPLSPWFVITLDVDGKAVEPDPGKSRWEA